MDRTSQSIATSVCRGAMLAALTTGLAGAAFAADPHVDIAKELAGDFFTTQLASSDGDSCVVDRIRDAWQAAGSPEVKGWADDVTDQEAEAAYRCILPKLQEAYAKAADEPGATDYHTWKRYNTTAYISGTHGGRFVNNYANETGSAYGQFEEAGTMPEGAVLAKDSFGVNKRGEVRVGPLFTMVKMGAGFHEESADWRYALVTPAGALMGATGGPNSGRMNFCIECHLAGEEWDQMLFLPDEYRVQ